MGGGVIQAMITSIKQNKQLLGNRLTIYTRKGDKRTRNSRKITVAPLTPGQKKHILKQTAQERLFAKRKSIQALVIGILVITIAVTCLSTFSFQTVSTPKIKPMVEKVNPTLAFNKDLNMAMAHMRNKQWFFAIGYFEKAHTAQPNNEAVTYQLALAYCSLCYYENKACKAAQLVLSTNINNELYQRDYEMLQLNCMTE
jgi:hypothetical protein